MAYVSNSAESGFASALNVATHDLLPAVEGDVVVFFFSNRNTTITSLVGNSGTNIYTKEISKSSGNVLEVFTMAVGATPDTSITINTATATEYMNYAELIVKEADVADIIGEILSSGTSSIAPSVTTTTIDSLILTAVNTGASNGCRAAEGLVSHSAQQYSYFGALAVASTYHRAIGATPTYRHIYETSTNANVATVTLTINDAGNGIIKGYNDQAHKAYTYLHTFGYSAYTGILGAGAVYDPVSGVETITAVTNGAHAPAVSYGTPSNRTSMFTSEPLATRGSIYSSDAGKIDDLLLFGSNITQTYGSEVDYDLTDKLLIVPMKINNASSVADSDEIGVCLGISDKSNVRFWQIGARQTLPSSFYKEVPNIIDTSDASYVMDEHGTFDSTSLQNVGSLIFGYERDSTSTHCTFGPISVMNTMAMTGGCTTLPCNFSDVHDVGSSNTINTIISDSDIVAGQFYIAQHIQIGGTDAVHWDSSYQAAEWPAAYDAANLKMHFKIGEAKLLCTVNANAGDTINLTSTTLNFGNYHQFIIDATTSATDIYDFTGLFVLNSTVTLQNIANLDYSGATFAGCKEITGNGANFDGVKVSGCVDPIAITVTTQAEFENLSGAIFENNAIAIEISGNHDTETWNIASLEITNSSGFDIQYTGTGTLTIAADANSVITTTNATVGTLIITAPDKGIVFNGLEAGSQVVIFATGTTTERFRTNSSSTTETYVATIQEDVDYTVMKAGNTPIRVTGYTVGTLQSTVSVQQLIARAYAASSGLTFGTNTSATVGTKIFTTTAATTVQNLYSHMIEEWIAQASLVNVDFPIFPNGNNSFSFALAWEFNGTASIELLSRDGMRYTDMSGLTTATWSAIWSSGSVTGLQAEIQQVDGATPTDTQDTGVVDQLVQVYGDIAHGSFNYTDYMVIKYQINGYYEGVMDVVDVYGTLADELYVIAIEPVAITGLTLGDPLITGVTITNHGATPVTWNGKSWSVTITDTGSNTGEDILRWVNYNLSLDATFQGADPFNFPDMVVENGADYATEYGDFINSAGATLKGIRVIDGSANPHPYFTSMQADDGTFYVPPVTVNFGNANLLSGSTVQLYNSTTSTIIETVTLASDGYSKTLITGTDYTSGDTFRLRATCQLVTAQLEYEESAVVLTSNVSLLGSQVPDDVYNGYGIDGSTITKFSADYVNDEVDVIVGSNFSMAEFYAWWVFNMTTSTGINDFFGGITAMDSANLRVNNTVVDIKIDNTTTTNIWQTDNIRFYRADEAYPVQFPTTGGGGVDVVWRDRVYLAVTGSGALNTEQQTQLADASSAAQVKTTTDQLVFTKTNELDVNVQSMNDADLLGTGAEEDLWRG